MQLRDLRSQRRLRRRHRAGRLEDFVVGEKHLVEAHGAAVGLALAEGIPVRIHAHAFAARRHDADQQALTRLVPGRDGELIGANRAGTEAFLAAQKVAAVDFCRKQPPIHRVQCVAPEPALRDCVAQKARLLIWRAVELHARELQMMKTEHMGERGIGLRQPAHGAEHGGPIRPLPAVRLRHRKRQQAACTNQLALVRGVAAIAITLDRGLAQAVGQHLDDGVDLERTVQRLALRARSFEGNKGNHDPVFQAESAL